MNKPSIEDIFRDLSSYMDNGGNPQVYLDAIYKKGRYTPEDFGNPQFDEQGNLIDETEEVKNSTDEGSDDGLQNEPLTADNANNYERLNDYVKRYNDLVKDKEDILNKYNGGKGYTPGSKIYNEYKSEIDRINNELESMENSDELKEITQSIIDNGLGDKWYQSNQYARAGLANIINKVGSSFGADDTNIMGQSPLGNTTTNIKSIKDLSEMYLKNSGLETNKDKQKTPDNKGGISSIAEDTFTDAMKFGEDVKSGDYVDKRNITLAQHLKARGLSTPEEIDAYLNKYPSWKNAKQEWKDNTIKNLTAKIGPIKKEEKKEEVKQETKKQDTKKEIPISSKKEEVKLWKPGSNWLPDDYSSINGVEEEKDDTLIYDKKGNPVGSKAKETKKQDTKKQDTKKQETKSNNDKGKKINIVKGSETIKNLLKNSKK